MEIEKAYCENLGWMPENLDELIREIHTRIQDGAMCSGVLTLFNMSFKIMKNRESGIMNANVVERDGEKGLNFLKQEFKEWVAEKYHNPGEAWKEYPERWRSFLNVHGEVDYSYHDRIYQEGQIYTLIDNLVKHPDTRRSYLSIYDLGVDSHRITQIDQDLNMTVMARSIDANNCLMNDIWLADRLLNYIVGTINRKLEYAASKKISEGSITFMISNLHSYPDIVRKEMTR